MSFIESRHACVAKPSRAPTSEHKTLACVVDRSLTGPHHVLHWQAEVLSSGIMGKFKNKRSNLSRSACRHLGSQTVLQSWVLGWNLCLGAAQPMVQRRLELPAQRPPPSSSFKACVLYNCYTWRDWDVALFLLCSGIAMFVLRSSREATRPHGAAAWRAR